MALLSHLLSQGLCFSTRSIFPLFLSDPPSLVPHNHFYLPLCADQPLTLVHNMAQMEEKLLKLTSSNINADECVEFAIFGK